VIVRIVYTPIAPLHVIGALVALGIWIWGIGAISLALYKRLQPKSPSSSMAGPFPPVPLPQSTMVGEI
jgi:hypothetical protein